MDSIQPIILIVDDEKHTRDGLRRLLDEVKPDVAHLNNIFFQLSSSVIEVLAERGVPFQYAEVGLAHGLDLHNLHLGFVGLVDPDAADLQAIAVADPALRSRPS